MGDISIKGRSKLLGGGRAGFKSGGRVGLKDGGRTGKQEPWGTIRKIYKAEGGRIGFASGSKRPKGGWTA